MMKTKTKVARPPAWARRPKPTWWCWSCKRERRFRFARVDQAGARDGCVWVCESCKREQWVERDAADYDLSSVYPGQQLLEIKPAYAPSSASSPTTLIPWSRVERLEYWEERDCIRVRVEVQGLTTIEVAVGGSYDEFSELFERAQNPTIEGVRELKEELGKLLKPLANLETAP